MNQHDMTRNMVLAALFAALTAIGAFLQIPTGTVPITLQFLFTALAGLLLGWKWGAVSSTALCGHRTAGPAGLYARWRHRLCASAQLRLFCWG